MTVETACSIHHEPFTLYDRGRYVEKRCLPCQRDRQSRTHWGAARCRRGHLKTPWTWRKYGGHVRCVTCANHPQAVTSIASIRSRIEEAR